MDFTLPEELRMLRETVARFVREELIPPEPLVLELEAKRGYSDEPPLPAEVEQKLKSKAKEIGLWGIDVPEEYGGQNLTLAKCVVLEKLKHSITPFVLPPDSPNLYLLKYAVYFSNVELYDGQVLGEVGEAFVPVQNRLGVRRMEIAARSAGLAARSLALMIDYANQRRTFGELLANRQAVQWWIADSYQELEMARLLTYRLACKIDRGATDFRRDAAMAKVQATEMVQRVVDRAMQVHGGMGMTKALPLEYISRVVRVYRVVEGPSEVHRWTLARDLLKNGLPVD